MDIQSAFNIALAIAGFLGGFLLKTVWGAVDKLREELALLQKSISETYVRRDDFKTHADRVESALVRIQQILEHKADK